MSELLKSKGGTAVETFLYFTLHTVPQMCDFLVCVFGYINSYINVKYVLFVC